MRTLLIQFAFAGLCFGAWPLFMNKSGLSGIIASFTITLVILILTFPFIFGEVKNIVNANWTMVLCAAVSSAIGLILLNKGLFKAKALEVNNLFVLLIVFQIMVPAVYKIILNQGITLKQSSGFIFAVIAAILLV